METNNLKRFAVEAWRNLVEGVSSRLSALGFRSNGTKVEVADEPKQIEGGVVFGGRLITDPAFLHRWNALRHRVEKHSIREVVEEAAYTWFNRLTAIRILVRNGLCRPILDYEDESIRIPRIVTDARAGHVYDLTPAEVESLERIINNSTLTFDQFSILIGGVCSSNPILSNCFGGITDYTMLLLPADIIDPERGFIAMLNHTDEFISEEDWRKPELIGWLYQFYISRRKDEVMAKKGGYDADDIPAATQIFTPKWIVKYMVQNTVGRIFLDNNPGSSLAADWKYLVNPNQPVSDNTVLRYGELENLTCADLSCGSGHILNEMFDILLSMYRDDFCSDREAVENIFRYNIVGIDLDIRARQLATFALMLKACQTDSSFADGHCLPRIYSMPEVDRYTWRDLSGHFMCAYGLMHDSAAAEEIDKAFILLEEASVLGSIMKFDISVTTRTHIQSLVEAYNRNPQYTDSFQSLIDSFNIILALTDDYAAICMNPPYMPTGKVNLLKNYANKNYPDSKADLFAVFMDVAIDHLRDGGKYGMINMQSWMFLSSFENLRKKVIDTQHIDSMLHLGPRTFDELSGEVVQNTAFVITKAHPEDATGIYYRLIDGKSCSDKESMFLSETSRYSNIVQSQFENIPGCPIAYWMSKRWHSIFKDFDKITTIAKSCAGAQTGNTNEFIRLWHEVNFEQFDYSSDSPNDVLKSPRKWFKYNKGGDYRKWFGIDGNVINWEHNGEAVKANPGSCLRNQTTYFLPNISWSNISSKNISMKYIPGGYIYDIGAFVAFPLNATIMFILGIGNSIILNYIKPLLNPTIHFTPGDFNKIPIPAIKDYSDVDNRVNECISISKSDWDAHETSWDFQKSPLLTYGRSTIAEAMEAFKEEWTDKFMQLHANEEELNRRFIEIYGLQDELTPDVPLNEVTILQQGEIRIEGDGLIFNKDVIAKQLISYAVGVMMGRYRLDRPGLAIAHPNPSAEETAEYPVPGTDKMWWIDSDGIVPVLGIDSPFHDEASNRLDVFIETVFGSENKTANLNWLREAIGKDITDYLSRDFYADHKKMYSNRPIYWMFSSNQKGKRAAFQCLVYMHRMNRFTAEIVRNRYLILYIEHLALREAELNSKTSLTARENKLLKQITADIAECRDYQERLHDFGDGHPIDLDDGVAVNYATYSPILAKLK